VILHETQAKSPAAAHEIVQKASRDFAHAVIASAMPSDFAHRMRRDAPDVIATSVSSPLRPW
jgi:hypothetical protein